MRITYTADDGTVWDSEALCLGWERLCKLLDAQDGDFVDFCIDAAGGESCSGMRYLFENRTKLYQLTDLMHKAMLLGSVDKSQSRATS